MQIREVQRREVKFLSNRETSGRASFRPQAFMRLASHALKGSWKAHYFRWLQRKDVFSKETKSQSAV